MTVQYEMLIPDMKNTNSSGNVRVSHTSTSSAWRSQTWYAFTRDNTAFDSEPNGFVKFFIDFTNPVYVEKITFSGDYLVRATVRINDTYITHDSVSISGATTLTIPKQYRANVKKIELQITGNGNYNGSAYFRIKNIQVHSPINKVLVEMHDNLYTFNNGTASIVKPVNEAGLLDYDKGVSIQDVKGLDKISPNFKIHVLDYKL